MLVDLPVSDLGDGLFNLGGSCSMSIMQVAEAIASEYKHVYGKQIPITVGDSDDSQVTGPVQFNIDRLTNLGFAPQGKMSEELQGTFSICDQLIKLGRGV